MRPNLPNLLLSLALGSSLFVGCASPDANLLDEVGDETGFYAPFRSAVPESEIPGGKADIDGVRGPRVAAGATSEVWAVRRDWSEVDNAAGMSWAANSGLDWEQKFDAWVASMTPVARASGWGETFNVPTPFGDRVLDGPTLECAEVALLLRLTFSSWYNLPFYIQGWDSDGRQSLFAGHFGFINKDGAIVGRFPAFRTRYRDYSGDWSPGQAWPSDSRLRGYRLGDDDAVPSLSADGEVGAGAYFDEMFLNKRVGYFARLLLLYFGSVNLVDEANMFHIEPEATMAGDSLVERWQRRGIGHVIPVMRHNIPAPGRLELWVASGSMPRRQPQWQDPASAKSTFTLEETGGVGTNGDGDSYASLGAGIRRWRTAQLVGGRWRNVVNTRDQAVYISPTEIERISARPARFEEILADVSPQEQLEVAIGHVDNARRHLRNYPASCAARTRREVAFERLYQLAAELNGWGRARTDSEYRKLEDYVFGEMVYERSRTCCWNHSTDAMAEIILDYAANEQADATAAGMCMSPTVFRAELNGFTRWSDHAATLGRRSEWNAWQEDESCSQRDVPEDTVSTERTITGFCEAGTTGGTTPPVTPPAEPDACDGFGQDDDCSSAIQLNGTMHAEICSSDEDFYLIEGGGEVVVTFNHDAGDIDIQALTVEGTALSTSESTANEESVNHSNTYIVRVYGYGGATNPYTISMR